MSLDRLEFGVLLFQTAQGSVPVELSFWQRIYLIWTFRHFRRLSIPLLNSRQAGLVKRLYRKNPRVPVHSYDPWLVIGVIENFMPPAAEPAVAPPEVEVVPLAETVLLAETSLAPTTQGGDASVLEARLAPVAKAEVAPVAETSLLPIVGVEVAPVAEAAPVPPSLIQQPEPEQGAEISLTPATELLLPEQELALTPISERPESEPEPVVQHEEQGVPAPIPHRWFAASGVWFKRARSGFATAAGLLALSVGLVIAWHRIEAIPGSQAHSQPKLEQINTTAEPTARESAGPVASSNRLSSAALAAPVAPPAEAAMKPVAVAVSQPSSQVSAVTPISAAHASSESSAGRTVSQPIPDAPSKIATITPVPPNLNREFSLHRAVSTPKSPLSVQANGIQATRPPLRFVYPIYPDANAHGIVVMTAVVDSEGNVRSVKVISGNRTLAASSVRAVRQWRYRPYLKDGQPVATETNIVISFFSQDAISMTFPHTIPVSR